MAARYRRTISATVAHRRATSPRAPISRWKMAENVYWLVTLNIPRAAIAMWTSIGSRSARNTPADRPRAITAPMTPYEEERPFAEVTRSGLMSYRSEPNQAPTRPKPVITSSAQSRMP